MPLGFASRLWYPRGMRVVVLTGGIGSGKSTAAEYFRSRGAVTIDLDDIAAQVLAPCSPALTAVAREFGSDIVSKDGTLDRALLASRAFADPETTLRLNAIVHPLIAREVGPAIASLRLLPQPPEVVVLEVPLAVEAPVFAELADVVLSLEAPEEIRVGRAVQSGFDAEDAARRLRAQATDEERARIADAVIANDSTLADFRGQLAAFWQANLAADGAT